MEENERALEVQARRLSELQLSRKPLANQESYFGYSMEDLKGSEGGIYPLSTLFSFPLLLS